MGKRLIKTPKIEKKKFTCEPCSFVCSNKKDFTRHLCTTKHKRLISTNDGLMEKTHLGNESEYFTPKNDMLPYDGNIKMGKGKPKYYCLFNCHKNTLCALFDLEKSKDTL